MRGSISPLFRFSSAQLHPLHALQLEGVKRRDSGPAVAKSSIAFLVASVFSLERFSVGNGGGNIDAVKGAS